MRCALTLDKRLPLPPDDDFCRCRLLAHLPLTTRPPPPPPYRRSEPKTDADQQIEVWKVKRLIKALDNARGNGTSMISLIMPPKSQVGPSSAECLRVPATASPPQA